MDLSGMLLLESMCEEWISICMWLHVIWICLIHSVAKNGVFFFVFFFTVGFYTPSSGWNGGLCSWHASHPYLLHRWWTALIPRDRCWLPSGAMSWGSPYFTICTDKRGRYGRQPCRSDQGITVRVNAKVGCGGNRSPWLFKEAHGRKRGVWARHRKARKRRRFSPACLPRVLNP